ncbi:MAG: ATP-binding cassette domain-containing protein [Sulfolobales archaeon]
MIRGVDLHIKRDKIIVIRGPNGSGKTTLMKIISLLYKPTKGLVYIDGMDYWRINSRERYSIKREIVYIHERPILLRDTVLNNITYGLKIRGELSESSLKESRDLLERFMITHLENKKAHELSAGQAQLVSIIRALVLHPSFLVLDEPISNLDRDRRKLLIEILREYKNRFKMSLILSLHEDMLLKDLEPDEVYRIYNGKIHEDHI